VTAVSLTTGVFEHVVRDAADATSVGDFRRILLGSLAQLVGADTGSMMDSPGIDAGEGDPRERTAGFRVSRLYLERLLDQRSRYDRSLSRMLRAMRGGAPVIDSDVYTSRDRRELTVYRELFQPQRTTSILAAEVRGRSTLVFFKRCGRASPFRQRDVSKLEALLPLIALADAGCHCRLGAPRPEGLLSQRLTSREAQVAALVSRGMRNSEIAALLGTSVETTKKQLKSVFAKTEVSNRTELAMLWGASS
jgi:DNA-binding CsgD family transcriptional regulator